MEYEVTAQTAPVRFGAAGLDAIQQSVRMILTTVQGSLPLDRAFGLDVLFLDEPLPSVQARMTNRIMQALRRYEPRIEVIQVSFQEDAADGKLSPVVSYRLAGGVVL